MSRAPIRQPAASLEIPAAAWEPAGTFEEEGGDRTRLVAWVTINGQDFHVNAFEARGVNAEGAFRIVTIEGREYVLVATPFVD